MAKHPKSTQSSKILHHRSSIRSSGRPRVHRSTASNATPSELSHRQKNGSKGLMQLPTVAAIAAGGVGMAIASITGVAEVLIGSVSAYMAYRVMDRRRASLKR